MPAIKFSIRGSRRAAALTAGAVLGAGALGLVVLGGGTHALATDQVKAATTATAPAAGTRRPPRRP
ncbi:hypothetical protein ABZZ01_17960 [Streptomyces virginiae]|uniref:hypothetical protein n=1 Tax=Streptomyces virginiae TaxID=1961 RepID=UPI0033A8EEE1